MIPLAEYIQGVVEIVLESLQYESSDSPDPILKCGPAVTSLLLSSFSSLATSDKTEVENIYEIFDHLLTLADEKINSIPYHQVSASWLRLYVDASIGIGLSRLVKASTDSICISTSPEQVLSRKAWLEAIKDLDMALIIAGGVGPSRSALLQSLIAQTQSLYLPPSPPSSPPPRPAKRARLSSSPRSRPASPPLYAPRPIPTLSTSPSLSQYLSTYLETPFVLRGYAKETMSWPALEKWADAGYLLREVGEGRVVPVEVGGSYTAQGWGQRIMPFRDFLGQIGYSLPGADKAKESDRSPLYLAQHPLLSQFPQLQSDISTPDYVFSAPPAPSYMPSYEPPGNEEGLVVNVWVGGGGVDPYYNCYTQVLGKKRVWLAPPSSTPYMSPFPGPTASSEAESSPTLTTSYTTNTSRHPIFSARSPSLEAEYPEFYEHVWEGCMEAVLEKGDVMVMPVGWWHAMRGEGEGVGWSVSMWY